MKQKKKSKKDIKEDVWINTVCGLCYATCGIKVRRINGTPVKIEGFPESKLGGRGGVCGKGQSGLQILYDPYRVTTPLRRTNPKKGVGVDPMWKEITWEEALSEIAERLKKIRADNPKKLWLTLPTSHVPEWSRDIVFWAAAFGIDLSCMHGGGATHCGNASHLYAGLVHASWSIAPDWKYSKYVIKWGTNKGTGSGHSMTAHAHLRADAKVRGLKEISIDPICNYSGGAATEWIPILPGTDLALALAIANCIVNEIGVYDVQYLKAKTNLPYLIGPDGRYVRHREKVGSVSKESGKKGDEYAFEMGSYGDRLRSSQADPPLVWDTREGKAKIYDDQSIGIDDYALEGSFEVDDIKCRPAFALLKEHLKQYTPDWAAKITTVPAHTIRRIAREWIDNAQIGSTITIDGKNYPFRPVSSVYFGGLQGHTNGPHAVAAVDLLNELVGAEDVPGGTLGWPSTRYAYPGGNMNVAPYKGPDGVVIPGLFPVHAPWPMKLPKIPCAGGGCLEYWPMVTIPTIQYLQDREEIWEKLGMTVRPEMQIGIGVNYVLNNFSYDVVTDLFAQIPFVVQIDLWSNETAEAVADILLPDQSYLEKRSVMANLDTFYINSPPSHEDWWTHIEQSVAEPVGECRHVWDILYELAERAGFKADLYKMTNAWYGIKDEELKLKPHENLSYNEVGERIIQWVHGKEGAKKLLEQGYLTWHKPAEHVYWRWNLDVRVPVYMEWLVDQGEKMKEIGQKVGLELDWELFTPLVTWFPTITHKELNSEYDLICCSYRDALHTNNYSQQIPWLDEASQMNPYTYTVTMNIETGNRKGLKDGDVVWLENRFGRKEKGVLKLMQGQHPQTVSIAGHAGLWAKGRPIARGKGSNKDRLMEPLLSRLDPMCLNPETTIAVKVYKVTEG